MNTVIFKEKGLIGSSEIVDKAMQKINKVSCRSSFKEGSWFFLKS